MIRYDVWMSLAISVVIAFLWRCCTSGALNFLGHILNQARVQFCLANTTATSLDYLVQDVLRGLGFVKLCHDHDGERGCHGFFLAKVSENWENSCDFDQ